MSRLAATAGEPPLARPGAVAPGSSVRILVGLALGLAVGLFFGERAAVIQPLADMYIRAMQMTVLPYLVLTLVGGLGQLDAGTARRLGLRALGALAVLLAITCTVIALMPLAFPRQVSASFYSDALVHPRESFALGELYVPSNPFFAMANAVVPGLVLFSTALGLALIGVPGKATLLANLRALELAVVRVTRFVLALTPLGVFAITAAVAGTLPLASLVRLEVYFVVFAAAALLVGFVLLPLAIGAVTPYTWRQVMGLCQEAMITAFVANSAFIVLPLLVERLKASLAERQMDGDDARSAVDVVVPICFVVPNAGKLLTLLFVPFAAWLAGHVLEAHDYALLFGAGLPSYFAKAQVALPFLMDLAGLPQDLFQLYIPSAIITGKFDSMVTVMSLVAVALLSAAGVSGRLHWQVPRLLRALVLGAAATALTVGACQLMLARVIDTRYTKDEVLKGMHHPRDMLPATLATEPPPAEAGPGLARIRDSGVLRVAFVADRVPFGFVNTRGELVGLDVELADRLARVLGAQRLLFVPAHYQRMAELLAEGRVDVALGLPYMPALLPRVAYSAPYLDSTLGLVVRDERRHDFTSPAAMREAGPITVALLTDMPDVEQRLRASLPGVALRFVHGIAPQAFMIGQAPGVDAFAMLAEAGAAWSVLHPTHSVVVPQPGAVAVPVGIGLRRGDAELAGLVNDWLVVQRSAGALAQARDYWVLGRGAQPHRPRWSVMDDVLGWGAAKAVPPAR